MSSDYAIHSDFLVYWTGKDLDARLEPTWENAKDRSDTKAASPIGQEYIKHLRNILQFGLWLTEEPAESWSVGGKQVVVPSVPKACFTELKLSESRAHARRYGRLGIGVKRPYLFGLLGRPLAYFGFHAESHKDPLLAACAEDLKDKSLLNFFKPMNRGTPLNYDLYSESEWRILFSETLLAQRLIIDPRDPRNSRENDYFRSLSADEQERLKYLAPLDGWFSLIIYPSIDIKNAAQQDKATSIREEIARIKAKRDHGNNVERGNWPIEINLDSCRHF